MYRVYHQDYPLESTQIFFPDKLSSYIFEFRAQNGVLVTMTTSLSSNLRPTESDFSHICAPTLNSHNFFSTEPILKFLDAF